MKSARNRLEAAVHADTRWPDARADERDALLARLSLSPEHVVLDAPSAHGYVARAIPGAHRLVCVEPVPAFARYLATLLPAARTLEAALSYVPLPAASVDRVCSLAGLHHVDKRRALLELRRVLRPGGRIALAEVFEDSPPARFLNGPVSRLRPPLGHHGRFWRAGQCAAALRDAGFSSAREEIVAGTWRFSSREDAVSYCRFLLQLQGDDESISAAIDEVFGRGATSLSWPLVYGTGYVSTETA